ncbi:Hypothetical protein FKW44_001481 [Caligus rogercresseyi]|uniref:Uncharacterized protein n=1 Tax=Caligus rogercresseyi TaxID=217165 RepID=A0A7T8KJ04_CALRO|nr:Hypothetical protein FKW44_001481 [Caligus rogercresseyi]
MDITKELDVAHVTLLACVNEDLRCHSYKLKVDQLLTQKNKTHWPLATRFESYGLFFLGLP